MLSQTLQLVALALLFGIGSTDQLIRRHRDITQVSSSGMSTNPATGFQNPSITQPVGNTAPPTATTPSPYNTYSASWANDNLMMNWSPNAASLKLDTSAITNLGLDNLGPDMQIIRTARNPKVFMPSYWICKSEPGNWSMEDHAKKKVEHWDGVRNYQANNNMKLMKIRDLAFMYHSISDKACVGIMKVVKEHYPDHTDKTNRFGMVDFEYVKHLKRPVHLNEFKSNSILRTTALVTQGRLSVMPISKVQWDEINKLSEVQEPTLSEAANEPPKKKSRK